MTGVADKFPSQLTPNQKRDWLAAHILYANNISAALAGPPTAAFYGSDVLWVQGVILVNDPSFEDARKLLHASGYEDFSMDECDYKMLQPPVSESNGKEAVKWQLLFPKERRGGAMATILAPASHWHFQVTDDTTIIVDGMRLPKFSSYLRALVSLLVQRFQSSIPAGYYELQTLNVWVLRRRYPNSLMELSPADRFFLEHFFLLRRIYNCRKVVELWDGLNQGILTVEEAVALVPLEISPKHEGKDIPVISIDIGLADRILFSNP